MLLIYTGDGKGKTSACVGQAVRALGQGLRVAFGQFMKKDGQAGEQQMLKGLLGERFLASGAGFFRDSDHDRHRGMAAELLVWARAQLEIGLDMLVLDEALYALGHELVRSEDIRTLVEACAAQGCHLVLSGRGMPTWLADLAQIVSEIRPIRHIYDEGGKATRGIEY